MSKLSTTIADWQPIESAPMDGRELLITDCRLIALVRWGGAPSVMAWYSDGGVRPWMRATHWCELPDPPTEGEVAVMGEWE